MFCLQWVLGRSSLHHWLWQQDLLCQRLSQNFRPQVRRLRGRNHSRGGNGGHRQSRRYGEGLSRRLLHLWGKKIYATKINQSLLGNWIYFLSVKRFFVPTLLKFLQKLKTQKFCQIINELFVLSGAVTLLGFVPESWLNTKRDTWTMDIHVKHELL